MAEDWAIDVRKYAPDADDAVIAAIVRHCGIALRNRDSSLVSFTDPAETDRVRESFCRKKLGLTDPDSVLDAAIAKVGERMKADTTKNRVTVYYLLAEMFGKLGLFGASTVADDEPEAVVAPLAAAAVAAPMAAAAAAPAAAAPATPVFATASPARGRDRGDIEPNFGFALLAAGLIGAIILGAAVAGGLIGNRPETTPVIAAQTPEALAIAAPATPAAPAIPEGSGVIAQEVEGKPMVSVYFDTAKTDIAPDFPAATAPVKAYVDSHPGSRVAVSGYNDPRGDAAFNAELSKNRAKSVREALVAIGIPIIVIDLVKPAETTDTQNSMANARRVDIVVVDAGTAPAAEAAAAAAAAPNAAPAQ